MNMHDFVNMFLDVWVVGKWSVSTVTDERSNIIQRKISKKVLLYLFNFVCVVIGLTGAQNMLRTYIHIHRDRT